jgi:hypothetical protein
MDSVAIVLAGVGLYLVYWAYKATPGSAAAAFGPVSTATQLTVTPTTTSSGQIAV